MESQTSMSEWTGKIACGDDATMLGKIVASGGVGQVSAVITDPKYNIGVQYGSGVQDDLPLLAYLEETRRWITPCVTLLRPGGYLIVVINEENAHYYRLLLEHAGLKLAQVIIWRYGFGVNCTKKFGRCHAQVLVYRKRGGSPVFNDKEVKIPSDRQKKYNDKRASPGGKIMPDVWDIPLGDDSDDPAGDVWRVSRVCGTFKERVKGAPTQLPGELVRRLVAAYTNPGDIVLDPHVGTGTVAWVSHKLGRQFIGIDIDPEIVAKAREEVAKVAAELARKATTKSKTIFDFAKKKD